MRVGSINNLISFGNGLKMAIPTDISKMTGTTKPLECTSVFGLKPIPVPICDSFIHVLK